MARGRGSFVITEWPRQPAQVRAFVIVCVALEASTLVAHLVGFGAQARNLMIAFGGFWPGALNGARELYPGQAVIMFATSAVLHGGLLHLFMNMFGILWLGPQVIARIGSRAFLPILGLSALGSGLAYALLSRDGAPMVGASGILFGMVGVLGVWELFDRVRAGAGVRLFYEQAGAFLALNVAFMLVTGGVIAWQAHLGGLVAGVLCGVLTWFGGASRWQAGLR